MKKLIILSYFIFFSFIVNAQPAIVEDTYDSVITLQVKTALAADPITKSRHIHVTTHRGHVLLSGMLDSRAEAHAAKQVAKSVHGVRDVSIRDIRMKQSQHEQLESYITQDIQDKLRTYHLIDNPRFPDLWINVETRNRNVYLTGNIIYPSQGNQAVQIAKHSRGVKEVYYNFTTQRHFY